MGFVVGLGFFGGCCSCSCCVLFPKEWLGFSSSQILHFVYRLH